MKYLIYIILLILFIIFKHLIPANLLQMLFMGFYAIIVYFITDDFNRVKSAYKSVEKLKEVSFYYKQSILELLKTYNATKKDVQKVKKILGDMK